MNIGKGIKMDWMSGDKYLDIADLPMLNPHCSISTVNC